MCVCVAITSGQAAEFVRVDVCVCLLSATFGALKLENSKTKRADRIRLFTTVRLQVVVVILRQRGVLRLLHLVLELRLPLWVHRNLRRRQGWHSDELQIRIADQFARQPEERLLEVVVRFRTDVVVLFVVDGGRREGEREGN